MRDPVADVADMLRILVARGFRFIHPRGADGDLLAIQGVRAHDNVIDVVVIRAEDEAKAARMPGDELDVLRPGTTLWQTTGQARSVLVALLALRDRTERKPVLTGPRVGCWVPTEPGHATWLRATTNA